MRERERWAIGSTCSNITGTFYSTTNFTAMLNLWLGFVAYTDLNKHIIMPQTCLFHLRYRIDNFGTMMNLLGKTMLFSFLPWFDYHSLHVLQSNMNWVMWSVAPSFVVPWQLLFMVTYRGWLMLPTGSTYPALPDLNAVCVSTAENTLNCCGCCYQSGLGK